MDFGESATRDVMLPSKTQALQQRATVKQPGPKMVIPAISLSAFFYI